MLALSIVASVANAFIYSDSTELDYWVGIYPAYFLAVVFEKLTTLYSWVYDCTSEWGINR